MMKEHLLEAEWERRSTGTLFCKHDGMEADVWQSVASKRWRWRVVTEVTHFVLEHGFADTEAEACRAALTFLRD